MCEVRRDEGLELIYVGVDVEVDCPLFVRRGAALPPWTDEEHAALSNAALGMAKATGHSVRECVIEIVRVVGDYRAGIAAPNVA